MIARDGRVFDVELCQLDGFGTSWLKNDDRRGASDFSAARRGRESQKQNSKQSFIQTKLQSIVSNADARRQFCFARLRQLVANVGEKRLFRSDFRPTSSACPTLRCVGCRLSRSASMMSTSTSLIAPTIRLRDRAAVAQIRDQFFFPRAKTDSRSPLIFRGALATA